MICFVVILDILKKNSVTAVPRTTKQVLQNVVNKVLFYLHIEAFCLSSCLTSAHYGTMIMLCSNKLHRGLKHFIINIFRSIRFICSDDLIISLLLFGYYQLNISQWNSCG